MNRHPWEPLGTALFLACAFTQGGCQSAGEVEEETLAESASALSSAGWSIAVQTAPQEPQDVWIAASGSNTSGWNSGGSICLGVLANDLGPNDPIPVFLPGDHAMLLTDVVEAGIFGVDGTPVAPGDYLAPGIPADARPEREFTLAAGGAFYVVADAEVINTSHPAAYPFDVGSVTRFMFTFDGAQEGRRVTQAALWVGIPDGNGYFYIPFINEGNIMLNARSH